MPSSSEAPSEPWISASEELVIWMFSTAMKAPIMAPNTASHSLVPTWSAGGTSAGAMGKDTAFKACD